MRIQKIYGILLLLLFYSCLNNDDNSTTNFLKKPLSIKVENSAGVTWEYHFYYANNLITKITDESGNDCIFLYDSNDRLISRKWNSNIQTNYYYVGNQISSIKHELIRGYTRYIYLYYNSLHQIDKAIVNENNEYENTYFYKYDATNRLIETIDEFGESEKYKYDNFNNPFKNVYPQMNERWLFGFWISELKNNVIANDNFYSDELTYEYIYDSDNFPILIKEIQSGTVNYTTIITYE